MEYFKCRNDKYYTKYTKDEIYSMITPGDFNSCLPFLRDMNYPACEERYKQYCEYCLKNNIDIKFAFGKYIACMRLAGFRNYVFGDKIDFYKKI